MTENETVSEAVETEVAAPVTDVVETPSEPETPKTADDLWDVELKLPEQEQPEPEAPAADDQGDAVSTEPLPEESPNPSEESDEPNFDKLEKQLETHDPDKPVPLTRKERDTRARSILEPFRDPNTPIEDVFHALNEFQPVRTEELARKLVYNSLESDPDAWIAELGRITGKTFIDAATVEGSGLTPNTASATTEFESQPEIAEVIRQLDEIYGKDAWRDPANDEFVTSDDLTLVKAFRSQIGREESLKSVHDAELAKLKDKLDALQPQVDEIATAREAEFTAKRQEILMHDVDDYRSAVETRAFPKVFANLGLNPSESDSEAVKTLKRLVTSRFEPRNGMSYSEFDAFVETGFSQKEQVTKAIGRVGQYLNQAADFDAKALRQPKDAASLKEKAAALRAQAKSEQDALTVWTQRAAKEFVEKDWNALSELLAENAELKRTRGGREEIVSATTATGGSALQSRINEAKANRQNPFDIDLRDLMPSGR